MRLSVALCTYNGASFIKEQLSSIANQFLPVEEIVVCDDGSSDNTISIVNDFANLHPEINFVIYVNETNLGVTKNFEKAIRLCSGDIIFLSDQDDIWRNDKTLKICNFFSDNPSKDIVFTDAKLINAHGASISKYTLLDAVKFLPNIELWNSGLDFEILNNSNRATGATMAFRSSIKNDFLPFTTDKWCLHDYQIAAFGCLNGSLGYIKECLISYRQHNDNVIGVNRDNWIFHNQYPSSLMPYILEPLPIRPYLKRFQSKRLSFYTKRVNYYTSFSGKLHLLLLLPEYFSYYHRFWALLFFSDLSYGISPKFRSWVINRFL